MNGFRECFLSNHPRYQKESGYLTVLVEPVCGTWGYTLWDRNTCLSGAKAWNWSLDEALRQADRALEDRYPTGRTGREDVPPGESGPAPREETATTAADGGKTTRTLAGHRFTLTPGRRYLAERPMAHRGVAGVDSYPVTIWDVTEGIAEGTITRVAVTPALSYDAANELLAAFNDGATSFEGRVW